MPAWAHRNQMTAGMWRIRLLVDPILPTDPTSDPSPAAIEALRQRMIADQLALMPNSLRAIQSSRGYTVQLPSPEPGANYRWELPAGIGPEVKTSIDGGHAELAWPGRPFPDPGTYELIDRQGQAIFRLQVFPSNRADIARTEGIHSSYWLEVNAESTETRSPQRFSWQLASGGALPSSWAGPRLHRVDLPLGDSIGTETNSDLAFFDSVSGWAATTQLRFKSVSAAESP